MPLYVPGQVVRRREVLHGQVWLEHPVTVVSDSDGVLAVRLDPGAPFTFPDHPFGAHPWSRHSLWGGSTVLQLMRDGDHYAMWKMFDTKGRFLRWYVNFEAPVVRGLGCFDVDDHGLDLLIESDGQRVWKDVEDLHHQRVAGRIDIGTVGATLAAAAEVSTALGADDRWWSPWDGWTPAASIVT